ncbi:hypothetical protein BT93_J1627 [Corymbia citriodora subsp. variegata]|nr:hypothetical protein BT93_J1627 [Corymbia citriodora subsp. variegata]
MELRATHSIHRLCSSETKKSNIEKIFEEDQRGDQALREKMIMDATLEIEEVMGGSEALPLLSLNHVSLMCRSVWDSVRLYNYGIGIHLIENPSIEENDTIDEPRPINPKDNHISFQCTDVGLVKRRLREMGMRYVTAVVEEAGVMVDQVFFHDPDGYMVEICNCDKIPILPISSCAFKPKLGSFNKAPASNCGFMETMMMESLSMDIMNFSF